MLLCGVQAVLICDAVRHRETGAWQVQQLADNPK